MFTSLDLLVVVCMGLAAMTLVSIALMFLLKNKKYILNTIKTDPSKILKKFAAPLPFLQKTLQKRVFMI